MMDNEINHKINEQQNEKKNLKWILLTVEINKTNKKKIWRKKMVIKFLNVIKIGVRGKKVTSVNQRGKKSCLKLNCSHQMWILISKKVIVITILSISCFKFYRCHQLLYCCTKLRLKSKKWLRSQYFLYLFLKNMKSKNWIYLHSD